MKNNLFITILAAGKGSRMHSHIPKVLQRLGNRALIDYVIDTSKNLNPQKIILVVGYKKEDVVFHTKNRSLDYVTQEHQLGTGHAVIQCQKILKEDVGSLLVLYGDVPNISKETLLALVQKHASEKNDITILSAIIDNPLGYGRIVRNSKGKIVEIIEEKDCNDQQKQIKEINTGFYLFETPIIFDYLKKIQNKNMSKEYYLTDIVGVAKNNLKIGIMTTNDSNEILGINTLAQLKKMKDFQDE